jgi:diguanylate cyclase (GGDEF)-like protein/PAS domain S-box-containing protein
VQKLLASNSISKKLMLLVSATAGVVVFLAFVISTFNDAKSSSKLAEESFKTLADVVAHNIASAIIFDDLGAAKETLESLEADNAVLHVDVLDGEGNIFASYFNPGHKMHSWIHNIKLFNDIVVERPVTQNAKRVGTIRLYADYDYVFMGVLVRIITNLLGLVLAYLLGYMFLRKMLRQVFAPIGLLTNAMNQIIDHEHYFIRVNKTSTDELGKLTEGFNLMLSQIEYRDAKLRQSDQALSQTQEAIALHDVNLCYQYVNPAFNKLFGYQLNELVGHPFWLGPRDASSFAEPTQEEVFLVARESGSFRGEVTLQTKMGKLLPISLHVSPIKDASNEITGYVSVSLDISDKKQAEEWIWQQANFDLVTGLPNRHMFHSRLAQEVEISQRAGTSFALMFLDLDDFKEVNDSLGHDMGDLLLKEVGKRLMGCLRTTDTVGREGTVARLGGDEFTIILSNLNDIKKVDIVAQRILATLAKSFQLGSDVVNISASVGITLYPEDAGDTETLIRNADQTMYNAKSKGRNTYSYFTRAMQDAASKRREMTNDLRIAVEQDQFKVLYQPIVDLATNKIYKAEALLRWHHPKNGVVNPADFIPVAEETGLIVEIGNWVFYHVAEQLVSWRTTINENFQVSINKSPVQFYNRDDKHLAWFKYLSELGIPGSSLVVEITEGLMLDKNPEVSEKLLAFRDEGIQVAVDDFGTGYSSLSYLKKFDVDYIKIDQSFVQNLSIHSEDMILCEAIIVMAHKLGLKVIAEGVETIEQRDLLFAVGCDYGQGYLFSKPIPADAFESLCLSQNALDPYAQPIYENKLVSNGQY